MNKTIGWVKTRENWSWGDTDWNYERISLPFNDKEKERIEEEIDLENNYSEQYRGCEIEEIKNPPLSIMVDFKENYKNTSKHYQRLSEEIDEQIKELIKNEYSEF